MSLRKGTDFSRRSRMDLGLGINVGTAGDSITCQSYGCQQVQQARQEVAQTNSMTSLIKKGKILLKKNILPIILHLMFACC